MSRLLHANVGVIDPVYPYIPNDFGFPPEGDTTPFLRNLVCRIAGVDRSGYVRADSMTGTLQLEGRDDLSLEIIDLTDSYRPELSEPVEILSNTNLLFRGHIVSCPEHYDLDENRSVRHINVRCMGAGHALDRRLVFGDIPAHQLHSALIQILQPSGVHSDMNGAYDFAPFPGPIIEAQRVNGSTALQYVQRCVNAAGEGWTWWLDWNGNYPQLHVRDLSTDPVDAPWDATDDSGNILAVEGVDYDDSEYANRVYVRMGSESISTITEQFTGGTFAEDIYALDYVPLEIISIAVEGVAQTFGIKSELWDTGDDTSLEWYYQPIDHEWFSNNVWRGPEQAAVASGDVIEVKYRAQTGSYVRADDVAEQAARASLMGYGSGIVEKILEVKDIADADAAQQYADAMLEKLKTVPTVVRYTTHRHGLKPGQTQTITLAKHGINGEYNISSVRFREVAGSYDGSEVGIEYAIEATSGTRAVPHPLRLHEDIIDAVRGAQEAARASGAPGSLGSSGGGGMPNSEIPRNSGDDLTFYVNEPFETNARNPHNLMAFTSKRAYNWHEGDYTVDGVAGSFTFASGLQPADAAERATLHAIYWPKGSLPIGNPSLGARLFAGGSDILTWGTETEHFILGQMSIGMWLRLSSLTADNDLLVQRGWGGGSITAYELRLRTSPTEWSVRYHHDDAGDNPAEVILAAGLPEDEWFYLGITRILLTQQIVLRVIDQEGNVQTMQGTWFGQPDPGGSGTSPGPLQFGGGSNLTMQEQYISTALWDESDHLAAWAGNPPQDGLVHSCRVLGASPEVDESSTGASGTVTGTTVVAGH